MPGETCWGGIVDNSLTKAFKECLPSGSVVLCREPRAFPLDDGSVDSLGKT